MRRRRFVAAGAILGADWTMAARSVLAPRPPGRISEGVTNNIVAVRDGEAQTERRPISDYRGVSISQFGGISGTDCSAALQRAIDHVEATGGYDLDDSAGAIEFGPGIWYINNVLIRNFGVRFVGAGKRATLLANRHLADPMLVIRPSDGSVAPVVADISFNDLQFRNTVERADSASFLIQGYAAERLLFSSVDFVSSPLAPNNNRVPLRCDFIRIETFESRWSNCNFWGVLGCAIEITDGPQSDTVMFDHCIWAYCTVAGAFGLGNKSGINGLNFQSCKVIGHQGGSYASAGNDDFAHTVSTMTSDGASISVSNAMNFKTNRAIVIGRKAAGAQYAFVRRVSGNTITLDRSVRVREGEEIVHGQFGFILGHTSVPRIQSSQFEGCDVGLYVIGGQMITVDSTVASSCARAVLISSDFRSMQLNMCVGATMGTMKNGVAWQFISIINLETSTNVVELHQISVEGSGYFSGSSESLIFNGSRHPVRMSFLDRSTCRVRAEQRLSADAISCVIISPSL